MPAGSKPRVYMDSGCFIDMAKQKAGAPLEPARVKDAWHCKQLLKANRDGHLTVFTSTLTIAECQHAGDNPVPPDVQALFRKVLMSGQFVVLVQVTPFIAEGARDLRWKHQVCLGGADAVHVASALDRGCTEFVTTDGELSKAKMQDVMPKLAPLGLLVVAGSGTSVLPDRYRQVDLLTGASSSGSDF